MTTRNDIVPLSRLPDEVIEALIGLRDQIDRSCWQVGAIANTVYDWAVRAELPGGGRYDVTKMQIYGMVGRVVGKSGRTVRLYAETEQFYARAESLRQEYAILPFTHFAYARRFGAEAINVLNRSMSLAEEQGYPPSIERLEAEFSERLAEIRASDAVQAAFFDPTGRGPEDSEGGAEVNLGEALISLVDEGLSSLGYIQAVEAEAEESPGIIAELPPTLTMAERDEIITRLTALSAEMDRLSGKVLGDPELSRARGLPREVRELQSRLSGLTRWVGRIVKRIS